MICGDICQFKMANMSAWGIPDLGYNTPGVDHITMHCISGILTWLLCIFSWLVRSQDKNKSRISNN